MPLAAGFGDGHGVPNEANRLNYFQSSQAFGCVTHAAGSTFTAARCL